MVIRMFEYGFKKGKEQAGNNDDFKIIYFPKQKVIFFEENKNIRDIIKLRIVLPDDQSFIYSVPVMKYWEYTDKELLENKMYPLLPLQLFKLRKELEHARRKNDIKKINGLSIKAKEIASIIANESKALFEKDEIVGEDFHKMLLAIQNLIEYLNRNYFNDEKIEEEVITMTKTLYDPEVEKKGIEKGEKKKAIEIAKEMLKDNEPIEKIIKYSKLSREEILKITI
jgi:predicted GNAT family acetyltransferase